MRRFRRECGLKKARILRERLILVSQGLKIGINRQPLFLFLLTTSIRSSSRGKKTPEAVWPALPDYPS